MAEPLVNLVARASRLPDEWLIGCNSRQFAQLAEEFYSKLIQLVKQGTPPKILLTERDPMRFLAGFIAACSAGCPVFLGNSNWVRHEWQQVFNLVQPDLIWGEYPEGSYIKGETRTNLSFILDFSSFIMIPTGGSSGKIRFAIHTWETLMASVRGFQQYFQIERVNSLCALPPYHVSGLMQFMRSFNTGGRLAIAPFKELEAGIELEINPAEFFISLVPTQLQRLLQNPTRTAWLSRFDTVLLGGSPAWSALLEAARRQHIRLAPTYGMTETASQIATLKPDDFLKGNNSCGQVLPHARVTIRSYTGGILEPNETGTITIEADSLALGYYPKFFTNQQRFQFDDKGFIDEQGYLTIVGRSSNKIITGGENVFPTEVETALLSTQLVTDVCVVSIPDKQWGEAVTAVYVPQNSEVSPEAIETALEDKLSKYKYPKHWISVESLPRNAQGKINSDQLRQIVNARLKPSWR